jgi:hypothetical protein
MSDETFFRAGIMKRKDRIVKCVSCGEEFAPYREDHFTEEGHCYYNSYTYEVWYIPLTDDIVAISPEHYACPWTSLGFIYLDQFTEEYKR